MHPTFWRIFGCWSSSFATPWLIRFGTLSTRFLNLLNQEMGSIYHIESVPDTCGKSSSDYLYIFVYFFYMLSVINDSMLYLLYLAIVCIIMSYEQSFFFKSSNYSPKSLGFNMYCCWSRQPNFKRDTSSSIFIKDMHVSLIKFIFVWILVLNKWQVSLKGTM